jgi:hypothetical protein
MQIAIQSWQRWHLAGLFACALVVTMSLPISPRAALAGPEGAQVVHGDVSFGRSGNTTVIAASDRSIINYSSFNIARPEIVQFVQPSSGASVLNRINSASPTLIEGNYE